MKKRIISIIMMTLMMFSIVACGSEENNSEKGIQKVAQAGNGKTLVVYFAVAVNSEVDAISSASVMEKDGEALGLTQYVGNVIATKTGAEQFSIQTSVKYPGNKDSLIEYAQKEQDDNVRPELTTHIENLADYDTIFIGYPIWWYDIPQVLYSFFDEYDFSGKTIVPFSVHNGSRFSGTIERIQELEPEATVVEDGFTVGHDDAANSESDIISWLESLGY